MRMKETHYIGAYWLTRGEAPEACAQRAVTLLEHLATCDSSFTHWFEKGWTLEEALRHRVEPRTDALLEAFRRQEERPEELGFSLGLWNGDTTQDASRLSLTCGCASPWVSNACVVHLPEEGSAAQRLLQAPVLARILRAMVLAWDPEWGVASSHALRAHLSESAEAGTFLGWVSYFSQRRGSVPPLPPPVQVEPVEDKGTLIILTPERFTTSNPAHLELALRTTEMLSQAGLLGPLRPWVGEDEQRGPRGGQRTR